MSYNLPGDNGNVVVAYVTSGDVSMPDPGLVTHINYAFAKVNDTFDGIVISNPDRLKSIVSLKKKNRHLKVLLSIGGWGSGNFSEMAADPDNRSGFCASCLDALEAYGLDGIDLDWEYPTSSMAGISSSDDDTSNFTCLIRELREKLGEDRLLTFASVATAEYVNFSEISEYIDFINVMTYDMGRVPAFNSALYRSDSVTPITVEESITAHLEAGAPYRKIVVGIPFYGHGDGKQFPESIDYKDISIDTTLCRECWEEIGRVPYVTDTTGTIVLSYDNAESIAEKCKFILDRSLHGAMYWHSGADTEDHELATKVARMIL